MKRNMMKYILPAILIVLCTSTVVAQGLRSSYFLEGSTFRHQLNPSFMGERNYISIPALGNVNVGLQGNVGVSDFIYKLDGNPKYDLTTFMDGTVKRDDFLNNLHDNNKISANINMTLLSFGFHSWGGFNTFEIGLRSNTDINMPYDLFNFVKSGLDNSAHYRINDLRIKSNNYIDLSLGHAREINENLTVGAKVKVLFGGANFDAHYETLDVNFDGVDEYGDDQWKIKSTGTLNASMKGLYFELDDPDEDNEGRQKLDGFDVDGPGIGGLGFGLDLGATYKMDDFVEGLTLSASLLDLGFISWNENIVARTTGDEFLFSGFEDFTFDSKSDNKLIEDQFEDLGDDFERMIMLYNDKNGKSKRTTSLATTMNIGAEYVFPYYKNLSFGFLSTTRFNKPNTWTEGRLYANVAPLNWIDASVNVAASTFGASFGWILNFHPKGFNFFIGSDHMAFKVTEQFIPVNRINTNVNVGFNITFGGTRKSVLASAK